MDKNTISEKPLIFDITFLNECTNVEFSIQKYNEIYKVKRTIIYMKDDEANKMFFFTNKKSIKDLLELEYKHYFYKGSPSRYKYNIYYMDDGIEDCMALYESHKDDTYISFQTTLETFLSLQENILLTLPE